MANVLVASRGNDYVLAFEYSAADAQVAIYDEPVLAWSVDDTTHVETPVIPGSMPPAAATPAPTKPQFANLFAASKGMLVIAPDVYRGNLLGFLDWLSQGNKKLRGAFIAAPAIAAQWQAWAYRNPTKVW
jgi:hypothetical protein